MGRTQRDVFHVLLANAVTKTANFSAPAFEPELDRFSELVVTLQVTAASGTADFYLTTGDGYGSWDLVHFPQVTAGPKTFTARLVSQNTIPATVTGAAPGVSANDPSVLQTDTAGTAQGIRTLGPGLVRHGPWGSYLGYELVASASITYTLSVQAR